ncbi:MAG: Nicotinamide-nucleotide amidohydrolase PncC [Chlamydiia bacterium]|nr:Nicotinamide-nucleotide amidohydrolase PncC [Chlamydiia bacterium]MCH9616156.1 Nicotinamide-nucleotide amidohydrolase PncC [Chlamydiia bacterium]MCH9629858.1 Nicotinamide-nucleotide amidohydrolase PncC [Chlamydiia bacterium]
MRVEIVTVGDEIIKGYIKDTNGNFIAAVLRDLGCFVTRISSVTDEGNAIMTLINEALDRADVVIVTGGLGGTHDDITEAATQALFETKPTDIPNQYGSALGKNFENKVYLFPGFPPQMKPMILEWLVPELKVHLEGQVFTRAISFMRTFESDIDPTLVRLKEEHPGLEVGICPSFGKLSIYLRAPFPLDKIAETIIEIYPERYFEGNDLALAVHEEMIRQGKTLSLAESLSGGHLAARLTAIPGASEYFLGSIVSYSNHVKETVLDVDLSDGAVSEKCARGMAEGARKVADADYAISVTGIAGPDGGTKDKPVGTVWTAIASDKEIDTELLELAGDRATIIERTVSYTLAKLWKKITNS